MKELVAEEFSLLLRAVQVSLYTEKGPTLSFQVALNMMDDIIYNIGNRFLLQSDLR